jgi:hypothetical protein
MPTKKPTEVEVSAIHLYRCGASSLEVAAALGVSKAWVLRKVRAAGAVRGLYEAFSLSKRKYKQGPECHQWKGGRKMHSSGYLQIMVKGHPHADRFGYVMEHRLLMEASIGRILEPSEDVHHLNGNKTDNRIDNLEIKTRSAHMALHAKERERHAAGHFGSNPRRNRCQQ